MCCSNDIDPNHRFEWCCQNISNIFQIDWNLFRLQSSFMCTFGVCYQIDDNVQASSACFKFFASFFVSFDWNSSFPQRMMFEWQIGSNVPNGMCIIMWKRKAKCFAEKKTWKTENSANFSHHNIKFHAFYHSPLNVPFDAWQCYMGPMWFDRMSL